MKRSTTKKGRSKENLSEKRERDTAFNWLKSDFRWLIAGIVAIAFVCVAIIVFALIIFRGYDVTWSLNPLAIAMSPPSTLPRSLTVTPTPTLAATVATSTATPSLTATTTSTATQVQTATPTIAPKAIENAAVANALEFRSRWIPYNPDTAFYKYAQQNNLGYPQTKEYPYVVGTDQYLGQVYEQAIVYAKKDDYANVKKVAKSDVGPFQFADPAVAGAIAAAELLRPWVETSRDAALYKFAEFRHFGDPQTGEFEFTVQGVVFVEQVFTRDILYTERGQYDFSFIQYTETPN